jgi:flagellar basal-body rod modification protein FlgD
MTTPVSSSSGTTDPTAAVANTAVGQLAGNFDQFLQLLMAQLQNQDPMSPMDTNQFTQQLVEFSGVEQQLQTNSTLTSLLAANDANQQSSAASFIGKTITATGATTALPDGGTATWEVNAPADAPNTTMVITDANGNQVYSQSMPLTAGSQTFTWNGQNSAGQAAPAGMYTLTITAKDAGGGTVAATTTVKGTVDGVVFGSSGPVLTVGTLRIPLSTLSQVSSS